MHLDYPDCIRSIVQINLYRMESATFKSRDGLQLSALYHPTENSKYVICMVHGMGEHKGRYAHVADFFIQKGYSVALYDQRGHGESGGKRGHTPGLDFMLDDLEDFIKELREWMPGKEVILYGHSMGGNIVLNYALRRKPNIALLIASSPYIRLAFEPPAIKLFLAKTVGKIWPTLSQRTGLDPLAISRDLQVVEAYKADKLVHDFITPGFFNSVHFSGAYIMENFHKIHVPCLLFHGTEDNLTNSAATTEVAGKSGGKAHLKLWTGLYHECHNEPEKDQVLQYMADWLDKQASKK